MALKLLVALYLVQVVIINVIGDAEFPQFPKYNPEVEKLLKNLTKSSAAGWGNCDETVCSAPCPGAYPPLRCPPDIPMCHFGCACHTDCDLRMVTCFETRHCLQVGRLFTARRRAKMS